MQGTTLYDRERRSTPPCASPADESIGSGARAEFSVVCVREATSSVLGSCACVAHVHVLCIINTRNNCPTNCKYVVTI